MKMRIANLLGKGCVLMLAFSTTGCESAELKSLLLDQITEFATAITSATITGFIQALIGGGTV